MRDARTKTFGQNVKAERNRKNMTQAQLSELINISDRSISLVERGLQIPSVLVAHDIAKVLDIDINELLKNVP